MKRLWKLAAALVLLAALLGGALVLRQIRSNRLRQKSQAEFALLTRTQAERGDAPAQAELCHLYADGIGVPRDFSQALRWCQASAQNGNAWGEEGVAALYYRGEGVPRDYSQALQWFQKAANQHLAVAEYWLATMYLRAYGTPENDAEAFRWYRQAADQRDPRAEYAVSWMYHYGRGVPQNSALDRLWAVRAADHGDPYAREVVAAPFLWLEKLGILAAAFVGVTLCLGRVGPLPIDSGPHPMRARLTVGALLVLLSAFNWYGYAHHMFRNLLYGVTLLTVVHWVSSATVFILCLLLVKPRRPRQPRPDPSDAQAAGGVG